MLIKIKDLTEMTYKELFFYNIYRIPMELICECSGFIQDSVYIDLTCKFCQGNLISAIPLEEVV